MQPSRGSYTGRLSHFYVIAKLNGYTVFINVNGKHGECICTRVRLVSPTPYSNFPSLDNLRQLPVMLTISYCVVVNDSILSLFSLSGNTSYRKISWSLEAARFGFKLFQSLWNLASTSAALLPRCLSNFRAIRPLQHPISRLRDFTRFTA